MCVDDYQFRHYTAIKEKQCRRFLFINEDQVERVFLVNISQFQQNGEVALCKILFHLGNKGLPITNRKFYLPKYNVSIQPGDYCKVPFEALRDKQIIFHQIIIDKSQQNTNSNGSFKLKMDIQEIITQNKKSNQESSAQSFNCNQCIGHINQNQICQINSELKKQNFLKQQQQVKFDDSHNKRLKQPQRKLRQVIIAVKKWRKLYESKKLNLTKAATVIGISKKSLDDYYLVLRVGQFLRFDYKSHLDNKMGDLRAYIRTFDYKVTGKLTKQVKCFDLVPQVQVDNIIEQQQQSNSNDKQVHFSENLA